MHRCGLSEDGRQRWAKIGDRVKGMGYVETEVLEEEVDENDLITGFKRLWKEKGPF